MYGIKILCLNTGKIYDDMQTAADDNFVSRSYVYSCCSGYGKQSMKLYFSWIDKEGRVFTSNERDSVIERVKREAVELYQKGIPVATIEKLCDIDKRSIYRYLRAKGITPNRRK